MSLDITELRMIGRDLLFSKTPRKGRIVLEAAEEIVRLREDLEKTSPKTETIELKRVVGRRVVTEKVQVPIKERR